ncbi:MAG TPA: ShlB/FhaC/HecB family hemolysin secretion/activation protein [Burkholderiales bacterium]|nr:ShlB/FhaC/HecB family hemolysin secretion/activation protein [Burkholderiales bacterium]
MTSTRPDAAPWGACRHATLRIASAVFLSLLVTFTAVAQDTGPRFTVRSFEIEGDLPIPRERAMAILAPYTGQSVRLEDLQSAASALEAELLTRGFSFYKAVLPPQSLEGVAIIRVLPFRLANVTVTGNSHFPTDNVLRSLPALRKGESPNIGEVGRNRAAANEHPTKEVDITFRQSEVPDSVDAEVKVVDQAPFSLFASLNNTGERRTGHYRATVGLQHSNLWNRDHSVTATYTTSPEKTQDVTQYGLYYRVPFYSVSGALTAFYAFSDVNSGTIANAFDVSGRGEFLGLHWRQHLTPMGAYSHSIEAGLDDRFFDNNVVFGGTQLGVDVRSRPINFTYLARYDQAESSVSGSLQYARNIGGGSDNNDAAYSGNRAGAKRDFDVWRYTFDGQWRVSRGAIVARIRGQFSDQPLIPGEQFGLGGANSVRGLREREVTGESGISMSFEGLLPLPWEGLTALAFVDGGQVRVKDAVPGQLTRQEAWSVGLGLRWALARSFQLSVDAAHVLDGVSSTESGDQRIHFSLVYRF